MEYTVEDLINALKKLNPNSVVYLSGNGAATNQIEVKPEDSCMRVYLSMK